tara:strand:- start:159 stop:731 length:573 start_codon:yes stop_codon:yes gene_type:complete
MIIKHLDSFYIVNPIENFEFHNKKLLELIEKTPKSKYMDISLTDWKVPEDIHRPYLKYFVDMIKPKIDKISHFLNFKKVILSNTWTQQYLNKDKHDWHHHADCNFTNIYYVELPDLDYKTELYDPVNKSIINIDVKEGDLITFPAYIHHRSKENLSNKRKTIISFNMNCDVTDKENIESSLTKSIKPSIL